MSLKTAVSKLFILGASLTPILSSDIAKCDALQSLSNPSYTYIQYPGSSSTFAIAINDFGEVVGNYGPSPAGESGFTYNINTDVYSTLSFPGAFETSIMGLNNKGDLVGEYVTGNPQNFVVSGFLFSNGVFSTINYPGANLTELNGIDSAGQIVGVAQSQTNNIYFEFSNGIFTTLATYPLGGDFIAISPAGQIVGPFSGISLPGGLIGTPMGINDSGDIVGVYGAPPNFDQSGFLDVGGTFYDTGMTLSEGINDQGDIVGDESGCGSSCAVLLTDALADLPGPSVVPEPSFGSVWPLALIGLVICHFRRRSSMA